MVDMIELRVIENDSKPQRHKMLDSVQKGLTPFFLVYADPRTQLMDYNSMMKFFTDFELYPDIVNKSQVVKILLRTTEMHQKSKMKINLEQFTEILGRIAMDLQSYLQLPDYGQKIIFLMQKMNSSQGPAKCLMSMGKAKLLVGINHDPLDLMHYLRRSHP